MYPTLRPGTWWPLLPGGRPKVRIRPFSSLIRPRMHLSNVVFPQPLGPRRPYLAKLYLNNMKLEFKEKNERESIYVHEFAGYTYTCLEWTSYFWKYLFVHEGGEQVGRLFLYIFLLQVTETEILTCWTLGQSSEDRAGLTPFVYHSCSFCRRLQYNQQMSIGINRYR